VHNASVNPQLQSVQKGSVNPQQSVQKGNVNPQLQSVQKGSVNPQQSVNNRSIYPKNNLQLQSQKQSIQNQNASLQSQKQSVNNPSIYPSTHPQTQSIHSQIPQNQSVQQNNSSGREPLNQSTNSENKQSGKEPNKLTESQISRKSTLKASRNKSPPQVIRASNGEIKRTNTDSSGNYFYVKADEEKILSDNDICSHLDDYLNKEIVSTRSKESKPQNQKKGNGFRFYGQLTKEGRNQNGISKIDQDTPLVHLNVGGIPGFNMFGVLDGHGPQGHFVSQYCRDYFIRVMDRYAELCKKSHLTTADAIYKELKRTNYAYIIDAFHKADVHMENEKKFDYSFSGTTCNIVFQFTKYLVCASVGDSRGILVFDEGDKKNQGIFPLSRDHKPDLPGEIERIQLHGGRVEQIIDPEGNRVGPQRVWKVGYNYPGLAMSRSLGDFHGKEAGVISTPEIREYTITHASKYMIICSDGVWEFIQNEQVRDMGNEFFMKNDVGGFCTDLVKFAIHSWEQFDIIRDDITVVCVFF
jgi:serine/threonine protein phosphatase PrpC